MKRYIQTKFSIISFTGLLTVRKWFYPGNNPFRLSFYYDTGVSAEAEYEKEKERDAAFNEVLEYLVLEDSCQK